MLTPLPGERIPFHRPKAQSHKHPPLQAPGPVQTVACASHWLQIRGSCDPFLPFVNMPEQLSELRKTRVLNAAAAKSRQSCPTLRPHRRQPTRLLCPWDSPGKNPGVGCHFLLQCMKVKSESEVTQSCPTLCDPMDYSLRGSSVHGISQARVLEWGAIAFSGVLTK